MTASTNEDRIHRVYGPGARVLLAATYLCLIGTGAATLLAYLGQSFWMLDLLTHFRVQYACLLLTTGLVLGALMQLRWACVAALLMLLNLWTIMPLYWHTPAAADASRDQLDIVVFNVNYNNQGYEDVSRYLAAADADLVFVIEAVPAMQQALERTLPNYQAFGTARTDAFGILLFSRLPITSSETLFFGDGLPALSVSVTKKDSTFSLLGLHTMPPVSAAASKRRNAMLASAASWARSHEAAIVVGDLNATPWSHAFTALLERGGLTNSQMGFGLQTSWPNAFFPLSIPIDHALHSAELTTLRRSVGPFMGSDHRPVHLRIGSRPMR